MQNGALTKAALAGTVLQVLMVVAGHFSPQVAQLFPILGTAFGGVAGLLAGLWGKGQGTGGAPVQGGAAGLTGGLIGTVISNLLGDVPLQTIGIGTGAAGVAGVIGGVVGKMLAGRQAA